jgi:hypothetical protein
MYTPTLGDSDKRASSVVPRSGAGPGWQRSPEMQARHSDSKMTGGEIDTIVRGWSQGK